MILVVLVATMRTVVRRLMDGVEDGVIDELTTAASTVPGIAGVDRVRARWTGHRIEGDLVVRVAPDLSVGEAHAVADDVERSLRLAVPHLETMVVHVHPAAT
jgi:divalent metal cation (Fe/Co/Zn/Cd) transporter